LRSVDTVQRATDGSLVLTRYADVVNVLRDSSFGAGRDALLQAQRDRLKHSSRRTAIRQLCEASLSAEVEPVISATGTLPTRG